MTKRPPLDVTTASDAEIERDNLLTQALLLREALVAASGTMRQVTRNRAVKGQWHCPYCGGVGIEAANVRHRDGCVLDRVRSALIVTADLR